MPKQDSPVRSSAAAPCHPPQDSTPPFVLLLNDMPVAWVPAVGMIDACADILVEIVRRNRPGTASPTLTAGRTDGDTLASVPAFTSAAEVLDSWYATAGSDRRRGS